MADVAAARREARRKRILENSHNRLQYISGKPVEQSNRESQRSSPIPDLNFDISVASASEISKSSVNNGVLVTEPQLFDLRSLDFNSFLPPEDEALANDLTEFATTSSEQLTITPSLWDKMINGKYDIVLVSLLMQFMSPLRDTYFFLPIIMYTLTKMIWFPIQNNCQITNILLLLNGMSSSSRIHYVLDLAKYLNVIMQDIFIYLFITICGQSMYVTLQEYWIT